MESGVGPCEVRWDGSTKRRAFNNRSYSHKCQRGRNKECIDDLHARLEGKS